MNWVHRLFCSIVFYYFVPLCSMNSDLGCNPSWISKDLTKRPSQGIYIPKEKSNEYLLKIINSQEKVVEDNTQVSCFFVDNSCCGVGKPVTGVPMALPVRCCFYESTYIYERSIKDVCIINCLVWCCQK